MKVNSSKLSLAIREYKLGKGALSIISSKENLTKDEKEGEKILYWELEARLLSNMRSIYEIDDEQLSVYIDINDCVKSITNILQICTMAATSLIRKNLDEVIRDYKIDKEVVEEVLDKLRKASAYNIAKLKQNVSGIEGKLLCMEKDVALSKESSTRSAERILEVVKEGLTDISALV